MSMLRAAAAARSSLRSAVLSKSISVAARPASLSPRILLQCRTYATKKQKEAKAAKGSTSKLVPGSKLVSSDPAVIEEYEKTEKKMQAAVDWFRREVANHETRATGRVTPALLSPVTVSIPSRKGETVRLEEVATVGVREGSTLLVTVFEEANLKHVETAIYSAKLSGVTPQRQDNRTLKIPIPKPTVEARLALYQNASRQAEDTRVQIRKAQQAAVKKGKYEKFSIELESFQKLTEKSIADVDKILADMKKAVGAK